MRILEVRIASVQAARVVTERDRLLRRTARLVGCLSTGASMASIVLPGALPLTHVVVIVPLLALLAVAQWRLGATGAIGWVACIVIIGIGSMWVLSFPTEVGPNAATDNATGALAGGGIACVAILLTTSRKRFLYLVVGFVATITTIAATSAAERVSDGAMLTSAGWIACAAAGGWLAESVSRAMAKIENIGRAYRTERLSSAREARRRHDARLMHDTVLATLTILAHSGEGVSPPALRQQARDDVVLLRRVRLGDDLTSSNDDGHRLATTELSTSDDALDLDGALAAIRRRFDESGLSVTPHGNSQIFVPRHAGTALLLAVTECLENVRRHSGTLEADVTISQDEHSVQAIVTDAGVGFDLAHVERDKMGISESVVARVKDVGGSARLFSSPGSGTTVALEVPL